MNLPEEDLRRSIHYSENCAEFGAISVLVGLIIEVMLAFYFSEGRSFWEGWGSVFADILVAFGVFFEFLFGRRAAAHRSSLQRLSDEKIAQANERASALEKAAAEANQRTAEIERLTAGRRINPQQHRQVVDRIFKYLVRDTIINVEFECTDAEAYIYAKQIEKIFLDAEFEDVRWNGTSWLVGGEPVFGLFIVATPDIPVADIIGLFKEAGIALSTHASLRFPWRSHGVEQSRIYIYTAHKPFLA